VPVTVTPFANTGTTITKLCGDTIVTPGATNCTGTKNGICSFTRSQIVSVAIPVEFGATAEVGDTYVNCLAATNEDLCNENSAQ
jgi:hypothetical protein